MLDWSDSARFGRLARELLDLQAGAAHPVGSLLPGVLEKGSPPKRSQPLERSQACMPRALREAQVIDFRAGDF